MCKIGSVINLVCYFEVKHRGNVKCSRTLKLIKKLTGGVKIIGVFFKGRNMEYARTKKNWSCPRKCEPLYLDYCISGFSLIDTFKIKSGMHAD